MHRLFYAASRQLLRGLKKNLVDDAFFQTFSLFGRIKGGNLSQLGRSWNEKWRKYAHARRSAKINEKHRNFSYYSFRVFRFLFKLHQNAIGPRKGRRN